MDRQAPARVGDLAGTTSVLKPQTARERASASTVLGKRREPVLATIPRQPVRVLQTRNAPAQLSLFLRPAAMLR